MEIIKANNVVYEYIRRDEEGNVEGITRAVNDVSLDIEQGQFIAILGHNGSGKSTLAKHMNAILNPTEGTLWVDGMDTKDEDNIWKVRQTAGMVFQNPDNQIIGQVVEEDVGFGPENMGIPTEEIWQRVEESLRAVGMYEYRKYSPNKLSGGQKQRVSIAGVLAMHPKCIVLDEPTAMLDPSGRKEVIRAVRGLNQVEGVTLILITHYMEEIIHADKVFVMDEGRAVHQDIRPLQILILNLMPLKEETELQLLRSLSNTPLQVDVTFMAVESHQAKNTSANHLNKFYQTFSELKDMKFDGMIVTGAPVEQMEFEEVDYWNELTEIMDWTESFSVLGCTGKSVSFLRTSETSARSQNVWSLLAQSSES